MDPIPEMKVTIEIDDGEKFSRNVSEDLHVSPETINEALMHQAALYAYYASLYHTAQRLANLRELALDNMKANMWEVAREQLSENGTSKWSTSRDRIDAAINRTPQMQAARKAVIMAVSNAEKLKSLMKALEHRKDMIMNMAYGMRKEWDFVGGSRIKHHVENRRTDADAVGDE